MNTDWLILALAVLLAPLSDEAKAVAIWAGLNAALISMIDYSTPSSYWHTMTIWAILFSLKDFALMPLARNSLTIVYALAASCIFHQVVLMQILTYTWEKVTLFEYRSDFMLSLSVIMLATVIHSVIGGGSNGGKRVRSYLIGAYHRLGVVLPRASQKVKA